MQRSPLAHRFVVAIAFAALGIAGVAIWYHPKIANNTSPDQAANDAWARAVWQTLPLSDSSDMDISANFTAALMHAKSKAPIYVSFGDADSGPARIRQLFDEVVTTFETEMAAEVVVEMERNPRIDLGDEETVYDQLQQTMETSYRNAFSSETTRTKFEKLATAFKRGSDTSITYYLAAIAEDPDYLPAWFRLAKYAEDELFEHAIKGFIENDPDNSLPLYILAAEHVSKGDYEAALKSIQSGNRKPICQWYPAPLPKKFRLRYPDDEAFREGSSGSLVAIEGSV